MNYQDPFEHTKSDKEAVQSMMKDRRAVEMVRSFVSKSQTYREPFVELARKSRELYETWQTSSVSITQRANLKLPFGFTIIETQLPQIIDLFFQGDEVINFQGQDADDAQWEHLITDFHHHQFEEMAFKSKTAAFIKSMLLDGTAVAKIPYRYKEIETVKRETVTDPLTGDFSRLKSPSIEIVFDGPDMDLVPVYDFFPDWSTKVPGDITAMRGCVHRMYKTVASLRSSGLYKNIDKVEASVRCKGSQAWAPPYYDADTQKDQFEQLQDQGQPGIKNDGRVEIWEYWGLWDPANDGKFEEFIITIANGDVVIREEKNFYDYKFKPFVACVNYMRETEFYGIPELIVVRGLIKEANTLRNARLDNINLSVNPMWLADRSAGINSKSLYSRPNGIVWTNDINGIRPIPPQDPSLGSRDEMLAIQQDIQNATALVNAAPIASSLGKQFGRSATGVNFINSFSSSRLGLKARLLSDLFFKRVAEIMLLTNRQFVTEDKWVRVSDPNSPNPFAMLPTDAFLRKFDFIPKTNLETGGPEAQYQKMQAVAQIVQSFESSQPGSTKPEILLEALLRPLVGRHVKRFVRSDEERAQLQAQQLAATQAVNAAQGAAAPQPAAGGEAGLEVSPQIQSLQNMGLI